MQAFDALIAWCAQPHPQQFPRLKRVIGAALQRFDSMNGQSVEAYRWSGTLVASTEAVRSVTSHLIGSLPAGFGQLGEVRVSLTNTTTEDAWIGIQGLNVEPEWGEDVHLEPAENVFDPATLLFYTGIYMPGNVSQHFDVQLWPTYLFGG